MNNVSLTVIVPCYNVEKYLDNFIKKLSAQTLKNFRVIFIEDCSKDNTKKMLKEIEKKYDYCTVIYNDVNHGAGYSRNEAIKISDTKYISFLDADDIFPEDYLEKLYNGICKNDCDMSVCDMQVQYDDSFGHRPSEYNKLSWSENVSRIKLIDNTLAASPVNKIIKREIIMNNLFGEGMINEDIPAIIGSIIDCKKINYVRDVYYTYIQHGNSVQNSSLSDKKLDVFRALNLLYERKKGNPILQKVSDALVFHQILLFYFFAICQDPKFSVRKKYMKKFHDLTANYNLRGNNHYWRFIDNQPKIYKIYYKALLKTTCLKLYSVSSFIVSLHNFYKKLKPGVKNSVVKNPISLNDLKKEAIKNQKKSSNFGTISVIVPNYNYASYLFRRIYSILYQNVKIDELIILDDKSTDNSKDVIYQIESTLKDVMDIKVVLNDTNSGCVYKQWEKGFSMAKKDYVWIAEADDYSDSKFLTTALAPFLSDDEIRLSYTDTSFMLVNGSPTLNSMNCLIDLMKTGHWDKNYINDGINEIENYAFLNCTIANVSSVVFKNDDYKEEFSQSVKYKQVGDWLFYVNVMKKGKICYTHKSLNYCCIHEGSSTSSTKKSIHFNEIKSLHQRFFSEYNINPKKEKYVKLRYKQLRREWNYHE